MYARRASLKKKVLHAFGCEIMVSDIQTIKESASAAM